MNFSYSQVLEFKRILDEKFGVYLHFHDACGGQYFSFDEAEKDEVYQFLTSYFANIGGKINIADNKLTFTVDKAYSEKLFKRFSKHSLVCHYSVTIAVI